MARRALRARRTRHRVRLEQLLLENSLRRPQRANEHARFGYDHERAGRLRKICMLLAEVFCWRSRVPRVRYAKSAADPGSWHRLRRGSLIAANVENGSRQSLPI